MASETITPSAFEQFRLSNLPPYAKLFVALFTTLMLCVCLWAVWIFYERKGRVTDTTPLPAYLQVKPDAVKQLPNDVKRDLDEIMSDSLAVTAPKWDSQSRGEEKRIDSADLSQIAKRATHPDDERRAQRRFNHNLGLAHTHINGQALLFLGIGLVFLFSSATPRVKKIVYWVFGLSILAHGIGLTGQGFCWFYDDLLAISGVLLLLTIAYMAFLIFVDLARKPASPK